MFYTSANFMDLLLGGSSGSPCFQTVFPLLKDVSIISRFEDWLRATVFDSPEFVAILVENTASMALHTLSATVRGYIMGHADCTAAAMAAVQRGTIASLLPTLRKCIVLLRARNDGSLPFPDWPVAARLHFTQTRRALVALGTLGELDTAVHGSALSLLCDHALLHMDACDTRVDATPDSTWDLLAMATSGVQSDGSFDRSQASSCLLPVIGCWNRLCTNLAGPSEAELKLWICAGCLLAKYCSRRCQRAAWLAGHNTPCRAIFRKKGGWLRREVGMPNTCVLCVCVCLLAC